MFKVLQITGTLARGGLETFVMNVYRTVDREKIQFDFLIHMESGAYQQEVESLGGSVYYVPSRHKGFIQFYKNMDAFFSVHAKEYCAVHMHVSTLSSIEALYFAKKYGIKIRVIHSHSSSVKGNKLHYIFHYAMKSFVHDWATHYLGCSERAIKWLYQGTGIYDKVEMIKNGIEVEKFRYNENVRNKVRKELGLDDCFVLGHVGRFTWVKNHKFIIEIFRHIKGMIPNSKLVLVGEGILLTEIKQQVKLYGLEKDVLFTGVRSDINELLQGFDCFLMPSFYEGLPVSLVEAQCAGLKVFGSNAISLDTKITPNMYFISLNESAQRWAEIITEHYGLIIRDNVVKLISEAGFDISQTTQILTKIYLSSNV